MVQRSRAVLLLIILAFAFMFTSGTQVAFAISADTDAAEHPRAVTDSNDPTTFNIPVAVTPETPMILRIPDIASETWTKLKDNQGFLANNMRIPDIASETWTKLKDNQGFLANNITDLFINLINGIFNFFGLYSVDQLARNTTHNFWGALSEEEWTKVVKPFVMGFTVIAWMVAGVSIQIFSLKLATSTMNARRRASVIDYFQNWFVGAVFLAVGPRAINMIFQASSALITTMSSAIGNRPFNPITDVFSQQLNNSALGLGTPIAIVIYLLVVTGVTFMLNFIYLQRYVTLFVYAILCPIFMTFYFFDNTRNLFWNWIKELIGLAFMPAIHMLLIAIYMAIAGGTTNFMLRLVFLIMFIPLSEMIRKLTSTSGGTSGVAENLLGGMGMGLAMQGVRTLSGAAGAMAGGGMAEAALFGGGMGMGASGGGGGKAGGTSSGISSTSGGPAGFFGQGNASGGVGMEEMMSTVNTAKGFGAKTGGVMGAIAGGLMGAGTGNMGGIMMGAMVGQKAGGGVGGKAAGRTAGQMVVNQATYPLDANGNDLYEGMSKEQRQEAAFGPGADAPSDMSSGMRQDIATRNMAMVKGQAGKASQLNAQINAALDGQRDIAQGTAESLQCGDSLMSMGYSDHTDYYRKTEKGVQGLLYSTQQGDKRAINGKAVRSEFEVDEKRNFKETSRSIVNAGDTAGKTGLPQGWNI